MVVALNGALSTYVIWPRSHIHSLDMFHCVYRYCDFTVASLFRTTTRDVIFQGYTIPKGAIIIPDVDSVMKDPNIWSDPESFHPERFINTDGSLKRQEEYVMFFIGNYVFLFVFVLWV